MPCLAWDPSMSVNVPELDEQHRSFVGVLNELHDTLMQGEFHDVLIATELTLERLEKYVGEHFRTEEEYLSRIGYPDINEHRRKHEEFAARVRALREAYASGEGVLNTDLVKTMVVWLSDHLVAEDNKYAVFAAARQP
jgi:hemerythrin